MYTVNNSSILKALQAKPLKLVAITAFFAGLIIFGTSSDLHAQSYRYMDAAGNVIFVDKAEQVPARYRNQIPALVTPVVVMDRKQAALYERDKARKKAELERKKEQEERKKQKALEKQRREQEKRLKKSRGKKHKNAEDNPVTEEGDFSQVPEQQKAEVAPVEEE